MKFSFEELKKNTELGGRVILFELPTVEDSPNNACHVFSNGIYAITFVKCDDTTDELIDFVAKCASRCKFRC